MVVKNNCSTLQYYLQSPNDPSPVNHPCLIEFNKNIEDCDSNLDDAESIIGDAVMLINDINSKHVWDKSYRPEFMEMDGIEISLTLTYGVEPESICNNNA